MVKDPVEILQKIVESLGDCESFTRNEICKLCPLGNKIVNGRKVNCADYLKVRHSEMTEDEIMDIYEKAAAEELLNIQMDNLLSEG